MRVLVLGGGYAGVVLTRALENALPGEIDILVVDETGDHLVQHELHRLVRKPEFASAISLPLTDLFDRASVREVTVADVDADTRTVTLASGERLDYDIAAVCLGGSTNFYGIPGLEDHAHVLKRRADAESIREATLEAFEQPSPRLVLGGAGLAGVQLAGELAALAREQDVDADIVLLEQETRVAPAFDERFSRALARELLDRAVTIRTDCMVTSATANDVRLASGTSEPYDVLVWTGGIRGTDAFGGDRPAVRATLELDDRTFIVGDAARVVDADGQAVPPSAQAAVKEAEVAAENITRVVAEDHGGFRPRLERFTFDSPGWLVSVGDGAVAQVGSTILHGQAAKALKTGVGANYLASTSGVSDALTLVRGEYGRLTDE